MSQKYEIFFDHRIFVITDTPSIGYEPFLHFEIKTNEYLGFPHLLETLQKDPTCKGVVLTNATPGEMLVRFMADFKNIKAAGGLVINPLGEVLLIKRRGMWDLPKGKVEEGEFLRQAALREVQEECGIDQLKIISTIKPTFHIYTIDQQWVFKTTYWYEMNCSDPDKIKPQVEEEIEEIKWVPPGDLRPYIASTYPNIKMILALYASQQHNFDGLD